ERHLPVSITKEQVRNSPDFDTEKPVSRQNEEQTLGYYGYPNYWGSVGLWGGGLYPYAIDPGFDGYGMARMDGMKSGEREREEAAYLRAEEDRHRNDDPHLRSCNAVKGYHIEATDGEIGHVAGYLIDDETWAVRYLIVDTSNWWVGHQMLIAPQWITGVHWSNETVSVNLSRAAVKDAPAYDPNAVWSRDLDRDLYRHYGRNGYWADSDSVGTPI
ncbi:MAG: PRC-barrel domain containing protein, partial [Rhodoferax sp.]|nr:PRC-barrel domain containing protein [Rhodoferax sp.]